MGILIASKRDGFRRAGIEHPSTPTLYADDRFTPEQLAALEAEPMLIVHHVEDEPEGVKADETAPPEKPDTKTAKDAKKDKAAKPAAAPEEETPPKDETPAGDA